MKMEIPDGLELFIREDNTKARNFPYQRSKQRRVIVVLGIRELFLDLRHSTRFIVHFTCVRDAGTSSNVYLNGMIRAKQLQKNYGEFLCAAYGRPITGALLDSINQKIEGYKTRMMVLKLEQ